jgi:hypothetical protein
VKSGTNDKKKAEKMDDKMDDKMINRLYYAYSQYGFEEEECVKCGEFPRVCPYFKMCERCKNLLENNLCIVCKIGTKREFEEVCSEMCQNIKTGPKIFLNLYDDDKLGKLLFYPKCGAPVIHCTSEKMYKVRERLHSKVCGQCGKN